jgi:hypothetical protein
MLYEYVSRCVCGQDALETITIISLWKRLETCAAERVVFGSIFRFRDECLAHLSDVRTRLGTTGGRGTTR